MTIYIFMLHAAQKKVKDWFGLEFDDLWIQEAAEQVLRALGF